MSRSAIRIHADDNVACLLRDHVPGDCVTLDGESGPVLVSTVPLGHKIALVPIAKGAPVIKYGAVIGRATRAIGAGEHVHLHNLRGSFP